MSYTIRGRTVAYDNVASGAAAGRERTISGAEAPAELYPSGLGDTNGEVGLTLIAAATSTSEVIDENITVAAANPTAERVG